MKTIQTIKTGSKVILREDTLPRHSRSVPSYLGYTREQFQWRDTLRRLLGKNKDFKQTGKPIVGIVSRLFDKSKHINVRFEDGTIIGIDKTELVPAPPIIGKKL